MKVRLDKFLSDEMPEVRSEGKRRIKGGRVRVNGEVVLRPETKIDDEADTVTVDGAAVAHTGLVYLMMNKPSGVLSATRDRRVQTVVSLVDEPYSSKLFPAGRLDKDTEGLMLLTNDGQLSHNLLSPSKHVSKTYFAIISGGADDALVGSFARGMDIGEEKKTLPAQLMFLTVDGDFIESKVRRPETEGHSLLVTREQMQEFCLKSIALTDFSRCGENECCTAVAVTEGKFHQIKRMFEKCGREVHFLKRIAIGPVCLDQELDAGAYRPLTKEELCALRGN